MRWLWQTLALIILGLSSGRSYAELSYHGGLGLHSGYHGRQILSLDIGVESGLGLAGITSSGVKSEAYYHSIYQAYALPIWFSWGKGWFGEVYSGLGAGAYYIRKGALISTVDQREDDDSILGLGPAFRIESRIGAFFFAVEFTMGLGIASIGGGWGDLGSVGVGVRL